MQLVPVIWLVGLSGSGKTTLANGLSAYYKSLGLRTVVLDGDELRNGLNKDLGFSEADRLENLRRVAEVASLFQKHGTICICSFISPSKKARQLVAQIIGNAYLEVYVKCDLEICKRRDVKGLYKKALRGEIANFTGVSSGFEEPLEPFLILDTGKNEYQNCLDEIITKLKLSNAFAI